MTFPPQLRSEPPRTVKRAGRVDLIDPALERDLFRRDCLRPAVQTRTTHAQQLALHRRRQLPTVPCVYQFRHPGTHCNISTASRTCPRGPHFGPTPSQSRELVDSRPKLCSSGARVLLAVLFRCGYACQREHRALHAFGVPPCTVPAQTRIRNSGPYHPLDRIIKCCWSRC